MNTLKYKGYIGSVAYSEPDKVFFGKLEGIDDLVNYEGESVAELTAAFEEAVEDYLAFCEQEGVKPEKSYSGSFNVRIASMAHREIANRAAEAGISINAFVKQAINEALHKQRSEEDLMASGAAVLMDGEPARYGSREILQLSIPHKDLSMARELVKRMGWDIV